MLKFYYHPTPNPMKVALFLAEADIPFELVPVDTLKGEQHSAEFRQVNPNGKLPAIDDNGTTVFDSTAILLYLAEKHQTLLGKPQDKAQLLSWLMFIGTGLGPFSGQSVHFHYAAPESLDYAKNRYMRETERHYSVLDQHLAGKNYIVGDELTIADISAWGWIDKAERVLGEGRLNEYPNIKAWFEQINARPAVEVARSFGSKHEFKSTMDEEAKKALFPSNANLA
ncbi:glutathione S-transferase family protein [Vibrio hepatarius]|uniref:glutathione S-transferase family protein n=1 Tax=Vibrio hepatarius TaxID=171383 RepID=UPI00142D9C46|nr:glutathione S-transferase family protein [Vibrio hepatarius]NIY82176.1 glutathione S-transferase family protein [Vibrio hepatarius]